MSGPGQARWGLQGETSQLAVLGIASPSQGLLDVAWKLYNNASPSSPAMVFF